MPDNEKDLELTNENFEDETDLVNSEDEIFTEQTYSDELTEELEDSTEELDKLEGTNEALSEEVIENETEEDDPELKEPHIELTYNLNKDDIYSGLKIYHKQMLLTKNIVYTVLLGIVFVLYLIEIVTGSFSAMTIFLEIMCVVVGILLWYMPYRHRKSLAEAAEKFSNDFTMSVYNNFILVKQELGNEKINYITEKVKITEVEDKFIISVGKEKMYILPKRCIEEEKAEELRKIFKNAVNKNYKVISK